MGFNYNDCILQVSILHYCYFNLCCKSKTTNTSRRKLTPNIGSVPRVVPQWSHRILNKEHGNYGCLPVGSQFKQMVSKFQNLIWRVPYTRIFLGARGTQPSIRVPVRNW